MQGLESSLFSQYSVWFPSALITASQRSCIESMRPSRYLLLIAFQASWTAIQSLGYVIFFPVPLLKPLIHFVPNCFNWVQTWRIVCVANEKMPEMPTYPWVSGSSQRSLLAPYQHFICWIPSAWLKTAERNVWALIGGRGGIWLVDVLSHSALCDILIQMIFLIHRDPWQEKSKGNLLHKGPGHLSTSSCSFEKFRLVPLDKKLNGLVSLYALTQEPSKPNWPRSSSSLRGLKRSILCFESGGS